MLKTLARRCPAELNPNVNLVDTAAVSSPCSPADDAFAKIDGHDRKAQDRLGSADDI
jgi:hypothetical protein